VAGPPGAVFIPLMSIPQQTVTVRQDGAIATIEFGGTKGNSLPARALADLASAIVTAGRDAGTAVIVLRSQGTGAFCAGASFDELRTIADAAAGKEFFMGFGRVITAMMRCPRPIIARVQGKVVGGGVGLVAASDYAIAVESASVRLSELAVGIGPFVVWPAIERKIGPGAFAAMAIDADWRTAEWAAQHGLYARVATADAELDAAVNTLAGRLATANPEAVQRIKAITWAGTDDWPALLESRAATSGQLVLSTFARAAIAEFQGKAR
jgi:methylglutaconyl-CoA hydratase